MGPRYLLHYIIVVIILLLSTSALAQVCEHNQFRVSLTTGQVESCNAQQWVFWGSFSDFSTYAPQEMEKLALGKKTEASQDSTLLTSEQLSELEKGPGFFSRVSAFFKNLFSSDKSPEKLNSDSQISAETPSQNVDASSDESEATESPADETVSNEPTTTPVSPSATSTSSTSSASQSETPDSTPIQSTTQSTPVCTDSQLQSDPLNCGICGNACASEEGTIAKCILGRCTHMCEDNYVDIDGNTENGCECSPDEFESNDRIEDAFSLGSLAQTKSFSLEIKTPPQDADYFTFFATQDTDLPFSLLITAPKHQICLYRDGQIFSCKNERVTYEERSGLFSGEAKYTLSITPLEKNNCEPAQVSIKNS